MFPRQASPTLPTRLAPNAGSTADLVGAFTRALSLAPEPPPTETILSPQFRVVDKVRELTARLKEEGEVDFTRIVFAASCRYEVVAYFLALLEILRRGRAIVWQAELFGSIRLTGSSAPEVHAGSDEPEGGANGVDADVDGRPMAPDSEELVELVAGGEEDGTAPGERGGEG